MSNKYSPVNAMLRNLVLLIPFTFIVTSITMILVLSAGWSDELPPVRNTATIMISAAILGIGIPLSISIFSKWQISLSKELITELSKIIYYQIPGTILLGTLVYFISPLAFVVYVTCNIFLFTSGYTSTKLLLNEEAI